jgi:hypothetical protein
MDFIITIIALIAIVFAIIVFKQNNDIKKRLNNIDKKIIIGDYE